MLRIIGDREELDNCYRFFTRKLSEAGGKRASVKVGSRKGSELREVVWIEEYDFWYSLGGRNWNAFGAGRYKLTGSNSITCEINFCEEGISRRFGGAFGIDGDGRKFLIHRGKLGGGRTNVGRCGFLDSFTGRPVEAVDNDCKSLVIPIASFDSKNFLSQLSFFIHEVARFKKDATVDRKYADVVIPKGFYVPEYRGRWLRGDRDPAELSFEQGLVTNTLASIFVTMGIRVEAGPGEVKRFDRRGGIKAVFRIEPSLKEHDIFASVGRLFTFMKSGRRKPRKVLVVPDELQRHSSRANLVRSLREGGLIILPYKVYAGKVDFEKERKVIK